MSRARANRRPARWDGPKEAVVSDQNETIHRVQLPGRLAKEVRHQILSLSRADMSKYTYEHVKSNYKDARADLSIYDPSGKLVLLGREFSDRTFFWSAEIKDVRLTTT
jgi:hypothetical protein